MHGHRLVVNKLAGILSSSYTVRTYLVTIWVSPTWTTVSLTNHTMPMDTPTFSQYLMFANYSSFSKYTYIKLTLWGQIYSNAVLETRPKLNDD